MSVRPISALFHAASMSILAYGFTSLSSLVADEWIRDQYGGHWQFLTIQGLAAAWFTLALGLAGDLLPTVKVINSIKRIGIMTALPLATVISGIYWSLILFAPSLILPPAAESAPGSVEPSSSEAAKPSLVFIALNIDLALHAAPALSLLIDFFLLERRFTSKQVWRRGSLLSLVVGGWYGWWVERCASYNKTFPYPFLNVPFSSRVIIYTSATVTAYGMFVLLNTLHSGEPTTPDVPAPRKLKVVETRRKN